jgi:hypothetical protein
MRGPIVCGVAAAAIFSGLALSQARTMTEGAHRMEIVLERLQGNDWHAIDPSLVLAQNDRVRFKFRTNFDGFLYVMNQSTSGKYEQLFPRAETGQENRVTANQQYQVPSTSTAFRIAGPAGFEVVYWLVTPARLTDAPPRFGAPPPDLMVKPPTLIPRCDDSVLRARGDCVDHSAGLKLVPRGEELPPNLAAAAETSPRDLLFMQQQQTAVIASTAPLTGPVIYEFRLAHR